MEPNPKGYTKKLKTLKEELFERDPEFKKEYERFDLWFEIKQLWLEIRSIFRF